jgi:hypothetical protein
VGRNKWWTREKKKKKRERGRVEWRQAEAKGRKDKGLPALLLLQVAS